ncbi:hypothetical protein B0H16DRAFT_1780820 [Mycena metata]|uniref:Uncharacterized protein n=1 Tax=Mycena metata TaxID=1033252 RepID=A0AAD7NNV4_9AGAR|nr:hypothetical protein B0H16DRAFT_1780820 [Mycena metata]
MPRVRSKAETSWHRPRPDLFASADARLTRALTHHPHHHIAKRTTTSSYRALTRGRPQRDAHARWAIQQRHRRDNTARQPRAHSPHRPPDSELECTTCRVPARLYTSTRPSLRLSRCTPTPSSTTTPRVHHRRPSPPHTTAPRSPLPRVRKAHEARMINRRARTRAKRAHDTATTTSAFVNEADAATERLDHCLYSALARSSQEAAAHTSERDAPRPCPPDRAHSRPHNKHTRPPAAAHHTVNVVTHSSPPCSRFDSSARRSTPESPPMHDGS